MVIRKKGISAIVATVLIVLITVAAVTIIWTVIIPLLRSNLDIDDNSKIKVKARFGSRETSLVKSITKEFDLLVSSGLDAKLLVVIIVIIINIFLIFLIKRKKKDK